MMWRSNFADLSKIGLEQILTANRDRKCDNLILTHQPTHSTPKCRVLSQLLPSLLQPVVGPAPGHSAHLCWSHSQLCGWLSLKEREKRAGDRDASWSRLTFEPNHRIWEKVMLLTQERCNSLMFSSWQAEFLLQVLKGKERSQIHLSLDSQFA